MNRESKIVERIAGDGDIKIEIFSGYIVCSHKIPSRRQAFDVYKRVLAVAESRLNQRAMQIVSALKKRGIAVNKLSMGISPDEGEMGLTIETARLDPRAAGSIIEESLNERVVYI